MTPNASSSGRSRAFWIAIGVVLVPVWSIVAFISIDSFSKYTEVGDIGLLMLIILFALWSWWYAEDRDRRRALKRAATDGDAHSPNAPDGDGTAPTAI